MRSSYYERLLKTIIDNSNSSDWEHAVLEWDIEDCEEDKSLTATCICGKKGLRYLYTIRNRENENKLHPIGSSCILKFDRDDLKEETSVSEGKFRLLHAVKENEYISLSAELFSRKLLNALYKEGAFNTKYNNFNGEGDYLFLLQMFNKRDKTSITSKQQGKIRAIIVASLRPYLTRLLEKKVKEH